MDDIQPVSKGPQQQQLITARTVSVGGSNTSQIQYQQPTHEHLYVNQKQILQQTHPQQFYDQIENRDYDYEKQSYDYEPSQQPYESNTKQSSQYQRNDYYESSPNLIYSHPSPSNNQYNLYYPKPYAGTNKNIVQKPIKSPQKISPQTSNTQQPQQPQRNNHFQKPQTKQTNNQSGVGGYMNHWLVQEAELRRQLASIPGGTGTQGLNQQPNPQPNPQQQRITVSNQTSTTSSLAKAQPPGVAPDRKGMLSVSGRKKCSNCGDELGRGCAAMVVESLSLYYHINCFRCSVCHIQLGKLYISYKQTNCKIDIHSIN